MLAARSLRLTEIASRMPGHSAAGYKRIQRFIHQAYPREALWRLFQEEAEFVIGLAAERGWHLYQARMKIDETHRDLKHLLGLTKLMNQQQPIMEKMLALLLLVYAIGLLIGEGLRDHLYGEPIQEQEDTPAGERIPGSAHRKPGKKWKRYSGLFVLLKQKWTVSSQEWRAISETALATFLAMVSHPVPTHV